MRARDGVTPLQAAFRAALAATILILGFWWIIADGERDLRQTEKIITSCQEDEACWNCETMGNRRCGSETED